MRCVTQNTHQLHTIFGGGYVAEQHGEGDQRHLPSSKESDFALDFGDILKTLRAALSLR